MPNKIIFTENDINKIFSLYKEGLDSHKIGKIFNISCQPILRILKENKIKLRKNENNYKDINIEDVIKMYKDGFRISDIADKYHRSYKHISKKLKESKLMKNPKLTLSL